MRCAHLGRELAVVDERAKEAILLGKTPQDRREHVECRLIGMSAGHGRPDQLGARKADRIGHGDVLGFFELGNARFGPDECRPGR